MCPSSSTLSDGAAVFGRPKRAARLYLIILNGRIQPDVGRHLPKTTLGGIRRLLEEADWTEDVHTRGPLGHYGTPIHWRGE